MPSADFDIDNLAAYLHLTPPQVAKMADRGKLPGRKIGGRWRFSRAEIHHWLEDRIGASNDNELTKVESVLDRAGPADEVLTIAEMLPREAIAIPLKARTKASVITAMIGLASATGLLWDPDKLAAAVRDREQLHPTALENGVALLHPRRPMTNILGEPFLALGITSSGIPFGQSSGTLTDVFFLLCSTSERGHLRTLARLSRMIADATYLELMRGAANAAELHEVVVQYEQKICG